MRTIPTLATLVAILTIGCTIKVTLPGSDDDHHTGPDAANHDNDGGTSYEPDAGYAPADAGTWNDCDGGGYPPVDAGYYSADAEICLVVAGCHLGSVRPEH
jgi:hypothetical protein